MPARRKQVAGTAVDESSSRRRSGDAAVARRLPALPADVTWNQDENRFRCQAGRAECNGIGKLQPLRDTVLGRQAGLRLAAVCAGPPQDRAFARHSPWIAAMLSPRRFLETLQAGLAELGRDAGFAAGWGGALPWLEQRAPVQYPQGFRDKERGDDPRLDFGETSRILPFSRCPHLRFQDPEGLPGCHPGDRREREHESGYRFLFRDSRPEGGCGVSRLPSSVPAGGR